MPGPSPYIAKLREKNRKGPVKGPPAPKGYATSSVSPKPGPKGRPTLSPSKAPNTRSPSPSPKAKSKRVKKAPRARIKPSKVFSEVPSGVPKEYRRAIDKQGEKVEGMAKRYGLKSGEELLSKLVKGESNFNMKAVSSAGAKGAAQFMPGTRDSVKQMFGLDPYKDEPSAVKAAVKHLKGKMGHRKGLEGYNPGGGQDYVNYILGQDVGGKAPKQSLKGPYSGSKKAIKQILGKKLTKTQDWKDKEPGHSPTGDHDPSQPNAYASDLPYDQSQLDRINKKLGTNLKLGQDATVNYKGYRVQVITSPHGTGPHIHIGARLGGTSTPSTGVTPSSPGGTGGGGRPTAPGSSPRQRTPGRSRRRRNLRSKKARKMLEEITARRVYDEKPPPATVKKTERRKIRVGLSP